MRVVIQPEGERLDGATMPAAYDGAGRVQSVAVRLVIEREKEIAAFKPREYWTVDAEAEKAAQSFNARLTEYGGTKVTEASLNGFPSGQIADKIRELVTAVKWIGPLYGLWKRFSSGRNEAQAGKPAA